MKGTRRISALALAAALGTGAVGAGPGAGPARPGAALAVRGAAPLAERVSWRAGSDGVEWGELELRGASEAWRTRVVVARIDSRRIALSLETAFAAGRDWTVRDAGGGVAVALGAGQFRGPLPWGWVVHRGRELLAPGSGPLAGAVVVDSSNTIQLIPPN